MPVSNKRDVVGPCVPAGCGSAPLRRVSRHVLSLSVIALLAVAATASAQTNTDHIADLLQTPSSAGLGFISRIEASPYIDAGNRRDLIPLYLYEGERFSLNADRAAIKLVNTDEHRFDAFLGRRLEGFPEDDIPESLKGMEARNTTIDLGVSYRYSQPWGTLRASAMHDIGGVNHGSELRLGYAYGWRGDRWTLRPDISVSWRDSKLNNYYYGVREDEATEDRAAYAPGSGVNVSLGLYGSYSFWENWRLLGGVSVTSLDSSVRNSPIINDSLQPALFLGAVYDFGTPLTKWDDEGSPLLVKVFYGRASGAGCHMARIMTLRCTSLDHENPTSVTGVHVGRPFLERVNGWPLDFNGYVGVLFRNENNLQANGWQVDAYMKAFYYGFPWSRWVNTRVGMGFGISYANHVPWTEVVSQERRERPTSKLLNYLDPTIDVNVGDIFRSESWKQTYFGLGISHRSGIFASSRLLGSVNGGSNYIYAYLESAF